jgi:hypothetical protein
MKKYWTYIIILSVSINCYAQDSIKIDLPFSYEIKGKQIFNGNDSEIVNSFGQTVQDNPLRHFAIYGAMKISPNFKKKYSADIGIYFEQRNHSAGNNTLNHLVFYPRITLRLIDTLSLSNIDLKFKAVAGDMWDEDYNDILRFYNIDFHGFYSKVGYKKLWLAFYKISDLSYNIGLGLPEVDKLELSYQSTKTKIALHLTRNTLGIAPRFDYNYGIYSDYRIGKNGIFKLQIENRTNSRIGTGISLGAEYELKFTDNEFEIRYQYYDDQYNQEYFSFEKVDYNTNFLNYTGTQVYPLKNYFRPINQWALFTSFQGSNIHNFQVRYSGKKHIYKSLYFKAECELNILRSSFSNKWWLFPAYDTGIEIDLANFISMDITTTNKHMNLSTVYQGHSLSKLPFMSITLSMKN